jgi:hypothetical protein
VKPEPKEDPIARTFSDRTFIVRTQDTPREVRMLYEDGKLHTVALRGRKAAHRRDPRLAVHGRAMGRPRGRRRALEGRAMRADEWDEDRGDRNYDTPCGRSHADGGASWKCCQEILENLARAKASPAAGKTVEGGRHYGGGRKLRRGRAGPREP